MCDQLLSKIAYGSIHLGVVSRGYVGLPLALTFIERAKIRVTGFDVDRKKIDALERGETYIMHMGADRVLEARESGLFSATANFDRLSEPDALMIVVPTPLTIQRPQARRLTAAQVGKRSSEVFARSSACGEQGERFPPIRWRTPTPAR